MEGAKRSRPRYVGIDLGKRTYELSIIGARGKVERSNGKTSVAGRQQLYRKLRSTDKVGLEAGNLAFMMAKEIQAAAGCTVYVLNASRLAMIYASMKKTDKEDALKLARIVQYFPEDQLPLVAIPSDREMNRRKLLSAYRRAQQGRVREINLLHGLFVSQGITTKKKKDLGTAKEREAAIKELSGIERKEAERVVKRIRDSEEWIEELEEEMEKESAGDEEIARLRTVPGIGPKVAFAYASHVSAARFENAGQVSHYLGLVPRVYMSGDTVKYGRITKRGNGYVRALLVQAAWSLTRAKAGGKLRKRYEYMTQEKSVSKKKAIVAIARRLGELLYTLQRDRTVYESRQFMPNKKTGESMAEQAMSA